MRRPVQIPVDETGELKHVRQYGSHEPASSVSHTPSVSFERRMRKEESLWGVHELVGRDRMLRRVGAAQVLGAVAINDSSSPYDGGLFFFEFLLPGDYPFKPPKVRMLTRCYHSGVAKQGHDPGCLDITKDNWSPALTLSRMLLSYVSLIVDQNPDDPLVPDIAAQFKERRAEFDAIAREWTERYAHGDIPFGRWTRDNHDQFPAWMRRRVVIWLLIWQRKRRIFCDMPRDVALLICPYICTADAFACEAKLRRSRRE
jgi:ubiquitin-conjugating enzyme E2 D/E